jgi:hypothetical protein
MAGDTSVSSKNVIPPVQEQGVLPVLLLLVSRLIMFLLFQSFIALIFRSWAISEKYWLLTATLTNVVSITFLYLLFRREGRSYLSLFRFSRATVWKDIRIFLLLAVISGPVVFGPNYLLSVWLWNDPVIPAGMMFRPVERWLSVLLVVGFPVTIVFAELATYFGYIMPQLEKKVKAKWIVVLLPVIFLSFQHITMPFIPDLRFILYRSVVFLPFALMLGIAIYKRPTLFPYFAVMHGVMDLGTSVMLMMESWK